MKLSIADLELQGRRVFLRVDFNVPMVGGSIGDDSRIRAALPSIERVVHQGGLTILASHMGRPEGRPMPAASLRPVAERLEQVVGRPVAFASDCIGEEAVRGVASLDPGDILLLENLRFHAGEEANDPQFASALAELCDVYVNDAFGAAHRAHASTVGITHYVQQAAAGLLMGKELEALGRALEGERPYVSIVGGAKISGKIELIENFLNIADDILVGGAMAYTFLRAKGIPTGRSLVEDDRIPLAGELLAAASRAGKRIRLPEDHVVAENLDGLGMRTIPVVQTREAEMGLDVGPATIRRYADVIGPARTVVWNGPMGVFENPKFAKGTFEVARLVAESGGFSVVGGGDSAAALYQCGLEGRIGHVSTGGGAALEFLSGRILPGVAALNERD